MNSVVIDMTTEFFFRDTQLTSFILKRVCLTLFMGLIGAFLVQSLMGEPAVKEPALNDWGSITFTVLSGVILAPVLETGILALVFHVCSVRFSARISSYIAAISMAALHGIVSLPWGLVTLIPFIVLTSPFRSPEIKGLGAAMKVSAVIHSINNLAIFFILLLLHLACDAQSLGIFHSVVC